MLSHIKSGDMSQIMSELSSDGAVFGAKSFLDKLDKESGEAKCEEPGTAAAPSAGEENPEPDNKKRKLWDRELAIHDAMGLAKQQAAVFAPRVDVLEVRSNLLSALVASEEERQSNFPVLVNVGVLCVGQGQ